MRRHARLSFAAVALLVVTTTPASALTLLTTDKVGAFEHDAATGEGSAWIRVGRDRGLAELADPTVCPASATLQVSSYPSATSLIVADPPVSLPCERWLRVPDGYAYFDPSASAGGVRSLRYTREGLWVRLIGPGYRPVVGPVGYAQIWLTVGEERYLVRFHEFVQNDERRVVTQKPTPQAAQGEAAFWDTLWADAPRKHEAIRLLSDAVARDRFDGRSQFLLAMMRLYVFGEQVSSKESITPRSEREVVAATRAFARAVPLLWKDGKGDSRVPGFAAAATYARGIAQSDPEWIERGLEELDAAVEINHLFNAFDKLGVAGFISGSDPEYETVLDLLDGFNDILDLCSGQDEICFNSGMAPHNIEGTFLLFGDIYAKGGRVEDAREWYGLSANVASSSGWKYLSTVQSRLADVEGRVALYQDADPSNDPPLAGAGNGKGAGCAYCHNK